MTTKAFLMTVMIMAGLAIVGCSDKDDTEPEATGTTDGTGDSTGDGTGTTGDTSAGPDGGETATTAWGSIFPSGENAYADGELVLTFSSTPSLGSTGKITIYNASGTQVDYIDMTDVSAGWSKITAGATTYNTAMDQIYANPDTQTRYRVVWYNAVEVSGQSVIIRPHFGSLDFDTEYYVTVDAAAISATNFSGVEANEWTFATKSAPSSNTSISVAKSGKADFRTVQRALNYGCKAGQSTAVTINVANGTYEETIYMRNKSNVTIHGESRDGVILQYCNSDNLQSGSGSNYTAKLEVGGIISTIGGRPVMLFDGSCSGIRFENMTLKNTWSDERAQAEVFYLNNDSGTIAFVNCTLSSRQDTILTKGYNWFYNCLVEGNVDYVWGYAVCCLFEDCEICSIADLTASGNTAYIVQARCNKSTDPGYVFLNCDLTNTIGGSNVYLARSGGDSKYYDNVAYINCDMTNSALNEKGWYVGDVPTPSSPSATSGWKYYGVSGVSTSSWVYSYKLTDSEFNQYYANREAIFSNAGLSDQSWLVE